MATKLQVTFDCDDPHRLARFWAEALGYEKENHVEFVRELLDAGEIPESATNVVDGGIQFVDVSTCRRVGVSACRDPEGAGSRLFFQKVPEGKTAKNRVHLDLHVGADRHEGEAERLEALGAQKLWFSDDRGGPCWTMADVEGNEFCVD